MILSLRLEEKRLYAWGENVGLVTDDTTTITEDVKKAAAKLFVEGQRGIIFDVLVQIQDLFETFRKQQLEHRRLANNDITTEIPTRALDLKDDVLTVKRNNFLKKAWRKVASTSSGGWSRMRWINFDGDEVKKLVKRFTAFNDRVTGLLDSKIQRQIAITTQDTYREVLQLATKLEQFQQILEATRFGQRLPGSEEKGMRTLMSLAQFKFFHGYIENTIETKQTFDAKALRTITGEGAGIVRQEMKIEGDKIQIKTVQNRLTSNRSLGVYPISPSSTKATSPNGVWIEWKEYEAGGPNQTAPPSQFIERAEKLSNLLSRPDKPTEFRVPRCLGYFDSREYLKTHPSCSDHEHNFAGGQIGFVFAPPEGAKMSSLPQSLLDLLQAHDGVVKPTVTDRIALAHALASSLMFLHSVNWLHKGLRSDNVLFFDGTQSDDFMRKLKKLNEDGLDDENAVDYASPILSGFDYARPANKGEHTEKAPSDVEAAMYRHPSSQQTSASQPTVVDGKERESYCKTFDIYSLGVILVEIAFWMPIDKVLETFDRIYYKKSHPEWDGNQKLKDGAVFTKDHARGRPTQTRRIKAKLQQKPVIMAVGGEMGSAYQKVVKGCLEGRSYFGFEDYVDESSPQVGARLGSVYYDKIVRQLEEIKI